MKIKIVLISLLLVVLNFGGVGHAKELESSTGKAPKSPQSFTAYLQTPRLRPTTSVHENE